VKLPQLPKGLDLKRTRRKLDKAWRKLRFRAQLRSLYAPGFLITHYYLVAKRFAPKHAERVRLHVPRLAARWILLLNRLGVEVRGAENLRGLEQGPLIFFANHNSRMDSYVLLAELPFAFRSFWSNESHTFKEDLKSIIWFGQSFDLFFFHDKFDMMKTVTEFRRAKAFLRAGGILGFFPEGHMHADRSIRMEPFGVSCMSLAIETGATVLPITLANTEFGFERPSKRSQRRAVVSFGKPFSTVGKRKAEAYALTDQLQKQMLDEYETLRAGVPSRAPAARVGLSHLAEGGAP
jgi:1-acyl-sn-glycerol-3-phosphate acyltransferase